MLRWPGKSSVVKSRMEPYAYGISLLGRRRFD
jgi:hypothetical protein